MTLLAVPGLDFKLPVALEASAPPEERGRGRDDVRLLAAHRASGRIGHHRFGDLPGLLRPGDMLVVNTSATIPAALRGSALGQEALLHLSSPSANGRWVVELRHAEVGGPGTSPWLDAPAGTRVEFPGQASARLLAPAAGSSLPGAVRLWEAELDLPQPLENHLAIWGRPIRYGHVIGEFPLSAYQTVFASQPGSVEMPSAARPFTTELVTRLVVRGVGIVPLLLHCGVSSPEADEPPQPERFVVSAETAERVNATRRLGGRVVAVGTTVVRALESASREHGLVLPADGWTDLLIDRDHRVRAVDGVITGWHEPRASHLAMLEAIAGATLMRASYRAALEHGYLWHEFGDSHLILP